MAETLVSVLLEQLTSIARREVEQKMKLVVGVDEEVRRLQGNLQVIEAVLEDAQKKLVTTRAVEVWLKKIKGVSHEIENVLDAWNTALIKAAAAAEEEEEEEEEEEVAAENAKGEVRSFISFPSCCFHSVQKLVVRHDIAHKIKDLNGRLDEIVKKRAEYGLEFTRDTDVVGRLETTSFVNVSEIYGRESEEEDLLNYLLGKGSVGEKNPLVISIVGMGGIGKTALAQLVFSHPRVRDHFPVLIWVSVSNPFDQTRVAKAIIETIEGQPTNMTGLQNLMDRIRVSILEKMFFLVLDDVWCEEYNTWEPFKSVLKAGAQGSRILVTTRKDKVMVDCDYTINLEVLSEEHCWLIISTMAFGKKDENQLPQLIDLGREVAHKCKGLPLAAKTLGSLLYGQKNIQKWMDILSNNLWELEDVEKDLLGPLLLSYYDLPSAIKRCFLYCSFFPKNYTFSRDELVYHWIAHGYISQETSDMEKVAQSYFEKLATRSLFLDFRKDNNDDSIKKCKMHDIVHGFAQSMASSECLAIDVGENSGKFFKTPHHLSLTLAKNVPFPKPVYTAKDLRTLLLNLNGYSHPDTVLPSLFKHFLCLRALIVKNMLVEKFPDAVKNLIHLRLLNLSDSEFLRELPESMCDLCNLQTLDVSGCARLEKLPQRMGKLKNLRHLILDNRLQKPFPKGIRRLRALRTLTQFIVGCMDDRKGCKLGELKNLNDLRGALTIEGLENVTEFEAKKAQLKKKERLCHLSLSFEGMVEENRRVKNDVLVLNALEPPSYLETLEIISYKSTMYPDWIVSLNNLKRLQLRSWDKLEHLPPLGNLQFLESLEIASANDLKRVGVEFLQIQSNDEGSVSTSSPLTLFPNLIHLVFSRLLKWVEWDGLGGMREGGVLIMPRLQFLKIEDCPMLNSLPDFLHMTTLKELAIKECPILQQRYKKDTGEEWHKISHISTIDIS